MVDVQFLLEQVTSAISQVHQLLEGQIPVNVDQFFRWRSSTGRKQEERMPHFSDDDLCTKYGQVVDIDWTYFLRLGRPLRAWVAIRADALAEDARCLYPFAIQAMALDDPWNLPLCLAAVCLMEMLGFDSHPLRITLTVLDRVAAAAKVVIAL